MFSTTVEVITPLCSKGMKKLVSITNLIGVQIELNFDNKGSVVETEVGGEPVATDINEMWNFVYTNGGWKVAGIEPLN